MAMRPPVCLYARALPAQYLQVRVRLRIQRHTQCPHEGWYEKLYELSPVEEDVDDDVVTARD